ncbi:MAG: hypothetical protein QM674_16365 [Burkholderiaceae bacterium]
MGDHVFLVFFFGVIIGSASYLLATHIGKSLKPNSIPKEISGRQLALILFFFINAVIIFIGICFAKNVAIENGWNLTTLAEFLIPPSILGGYLVASRAIENYFDPTGASRKPAAPQQPSFLSKTINQFWVVSATLVASLFVVITQLDTDKLTEKISYLKLGAMELKINKDERAIIEQSFKAITSTIYDAPEAALLKQITREKSEGTINIYENRVHSDLRFCMYAKLIKSGQPDWKENTDSLQKECREEMSHEIDFIVIHQKTWHPFIQRLVKGISQEFISANFVKQNLEEPLIYFTALANCNDNDYNNGKPNECKETFLNNFLTNISKLCHHIGTIIHQDNAPSLSECPSFFNPHPSEEEQSELNLLKKALRKSPDSHWAATMIANLHLAIGNDYAISQFLLKRFGKKVNEKSQLLLNLNFSISEALKNPSFSSINRSKLYLDAAREQSIRMIGNSLQACKKTKANCSISTIYESPTCDPEKPTPQNQIPIPIPIIISKECAKRDFRRAILATRTTHQSLGALILQGNDNTLDSLKAVESTLSKVLAIDITKKTISGNTKTSKHDISFNTEIYNLKSWLENYTSNLNKNLENKDLTALYDTYDFLENIFHFSTAKISLGLRNKENKDIGCGISLLDASLEATRKLAQIFLDSCTSGFSSGCTELRLNVRSLDSLEKKILEQRKMVIEGISQEKRRFASLESCGKIKTSLDELGLSNS